MEDKDKLRLYRETLESIMMVGHSIQSSDDEGLWLSMVINKAWEALNSAGDIEKD